MCSKVLAKTGAHRRQAMARMLPDRYLFIIGY
jgi:hypothetical protein